jgi:hypothetical protein
MQGHRVDVGRWGAGGAGSGRVELGRVLRLLTAMLLLGVALLVVALLGQGVAAARPLTATPDAAGNAAPHAGGRPEGVLPPAGSTAVPAPHAAGLGAGSGARDDLARSLVAATDVLTRQAVPSPAAAARSPGGSKAPERPGRGSAQLAANANWGYAKPPDDELRVADLPVRDGDGTPGGRASTSGVVPAGTVTVAQAPRPAGLTIVRENTQGGTDDATPGGPPSSPGQPVAGGTVAAAAEAQPPSSSGLPPSTFHSLSFYLFTNGILRQAEDLRALVVGDRKDKDLGTNTSWFMKSAADQATSINKQIAFARELAGATSIEAGVKVADAPLRALNQAQAATRNLRNLSETAKAVADLIVNGEENGTVMLRERARSAVITADTADHRLATLLDPDPDPDFPRTPIAIVSPVSRQAKSLAERTRRRQRGSGRNRLGSKPSSVRPVGSWGTRNPRDRCHVARQLDHPRSGLREGEGGSGQPAAAGRLRAAGR